MGRLFLSERGRTLLHNAEEVTRWRWPRKALDVSSTAIGAGAALWVLLRMYEDNEIPLNVLVNDRPIGNIEPNANFTAFPVWASLDVPATCLVEGTNRVDFRCNTRAMNAWMIMLEPGHEDPGSSISVDRGKTWRNDRLGISNLLRGEYVVRLRSHGGRLRDPPAPAIVYEDANHPRVKELLDLLPPGIRSIGDPWRQLRALRTWVANSWSHRGSGSVYTPWDPWTILDWGKKDRGHGQKGTICMCVQFGALFTSLAVALGHRARCVVVTNNLGESSGHFMSEVWDERLEKWVLHDPNYDVHYEDGEPLSAVDLADRSHQGRQFAEWVVAGEGMPKSPLRVVRSFKTYFATGRSFYLTGIWSTNQYVSDPDASPPNHGATAYSETEIVWYMPKPMDAARMFPYRVSDRKYFEQYG